MALETGTYISDLVSTNPTATDPKSAGDDHLRLIKSTVKATFPNVSGAVTATHTELNIMDGVTANTSEINILDGLTASTAELSIMDGVTVTTSDINALSRKDGQVYTGTHNFEGATITVPDQTFGTAGNAAANVDYVNQAAFQAVLPSQTGNIGKNLITNGSTAAWEFLNIVNDTTPQLGGVLDTNSKQVQYSKGADVASGTSLPILTDGNYFDVTGTTTITSIATTGKVGSHIKLHFDGALTLTHHATDLILPGGVNITTAAGDEAEFIEYASGDFRCTNYSRASGLPVVNPNIALVHLQTVDANNSATVDIEQTFDSTYDAYVIVVSNLKTFTDGDAIRCRLKIGGAYVDSGSKYSFQLCHPTANSSIYTTTLGIGVDFIKIIDNVGAATSESANFTFYLHGVSSTTLAKSCYWHGVSITSDAYPESFNGSGKNSDVAALTGVRFYAASNNITSGSFRLYGIKNNYS